MQSETPKSCNPLLRDIETERALFNDEEIPILSYQAAALRTVLKLLQEDKTSLESRPKQTRSERRRARTLLVDIYVGVSAEVFMLCIFATTVSKMHKFRPRLVVPRLKTWLMANPLPKGLTAITTKLCNAHSIDTLVNSHTVVVGMTHVPFYTKYTKYI
jgi:hypothetical protein